MKINFHISINSRDRTLCGRSCPFLRINPINCVLFNAAPMFKYDPQGFATEDLLRVCDCERFIRSNP